MADNDFQVDPIEYNGQGLNDGNDDDPTLSDGNQIDNNNNVDNQGDDQFDPNTVLAENDGIEIDQSNHDEDENDVDHANKSSKSGSAQLVEYQPSRDDEDDDDDIIDEDDIDDQSEMIVLDPDHVSSIKI